MQQSPLGAWCQPAASLTLAEGVPLVHVAKILGHSTLAVTMRYAHFAPEAGRAGIEKLGQALAAGGEERKDTDRPTRADGAGKMGERLIGFTVKRSA